MRAKPRGPGVKGVLKQDMDSRLDPHELLTEIKSILVNIDHMGVPTDLY